MNKNLKKKQKKLYKELGPSPLCKHTLSTENKQKNEFSKPSSPYVIYEWTLGCRDSIFSSSIPSDISSSWPPSNVNQRSDAWST